MPRVKKRIARFVDVKPRFVSLVGRPASRKFFTEVLRAADLEAYEAAGGVVTRGDDPEVAEFLVALRNDAAGETARKVTFTVVRTDKERRVVYGAAYCPALDVENGGTVSQADFAAKVDTYGTFMDSDTLLDLAHAYMEESRAVDVDHSMKAVDAFPVESVFLREGEQTDDYPHPNTWKVGIKIRDKKAWKRVEKGELKAFSIAVSASFEPIDVWVESDDETASENDNTQTATAERGDGMGHIVTRSVVEFQDWPLADKGVAWDGAEAAKRCREVCSSDGTGDQALVDQDEYARCFLRSVDGDSLDAYDLGIVDVVDGERVVVPGALDDVASRLDATDLSDDDKTAVREHLVKYYEKAGETPLWERSEPAPVPAIDPQQGGSTDPTPPVATEDPPAPPATRAASKYMDHLDEMLAKSEANGRVWYALYALEDIVGACIYECIAGEQEYTADDVAQAFDDAKAFVMPALTELIALYNAEQREDLTDEQRTEAKRAAVEKVLAIRSELATRKGRVLSQANYEKLTSCHGLIREVLDGAEAADSAANPVTDNDGKPADGGEVMASDADTPATRDDLVARLDAMQARLDALEAVTRSVPQAERIDGIDTAIRSMTEQTTAASQATDRTSPSALHERYRDPEALARALINGDPEVDLVAVGRETGSCDRVFVGSDGKPLYSAELVEVRYDREGLEVERRPPVDVPSNLVSDVQPVWSGRLVPLREAVRRYAFTRAYQVRHTNALEFDFLHGLATYLGERGSLVLVGSGPRGNGPLIPERNAAPMKGFLSGQVGGEAYRLVLHLAPFELRAPEAREVDP